MKSRLLFTSLLVVAAMMMASAAFAAPTAKATPFKGSWDSSEKPTFVPAPPPDATIMFVDGTASGNATQLGKYTATFKATVDLGMRLLARRLDSLHCSQWRQPVRPWTRRWRPGQTGLQSGHPSIYHHGRHGPVRRRNRQLRRDTPGQQRHGCELRFIRWADCAPLREWVMGSSPHSI